VKSIQGIRSVPCVRAFHFHLSIEYFYGVFLASGLSLISVGWSFLNIFVDYVKTRERATSTGAGIVQNF
jgi:hypothetical protein